MQQRQAMLTDPGEQSRQKALKGEAGFLALLFVAAAALFYETFQFRVVPWDSLGMAFWPRLLLAMLGIVIIARAWHLSKSVNVDRGGMTKGLGILLACTGFVFGMSYLGIWIATPLFILLFAILRKSDDRRRNIRDALFSAVVVLVAVWLLFDLTLGLRVLSLPFWMR